MVAVSEWLVARWAPMRPGRRIDVASEMSRATLEGLQRTIFPDGLGGDPGEFARAMTRYFESIGQLHPFDIMGAPAWLPRVGRRNPEPSLRFFGAAVENLIALRRAWLDEHRDEGSADAPHDLLTLLLGARDPQTGEGLSEAEIRANILTSSAPAMKPRPTR
jgi:cytochrome P450